MAVIDSDPTSNVTASQERSWIERIPVAYWVLGLFLLVMPAFSSGFVIGELMGRVFILGMIALSLMFLGGYGGMVSLAQMSVAGIAGYMLAIFGESAITGISQGWPWYVTIPLAILVAVIFGTLTGWLAVRTEGIYTIMITLAIASAFFYFTNQNYTIFNGFSGFNGVLPPKLFGVDWTGDTAFYYLTLFWAVAAYLFVLYVSRSPFGLALQGVRDNPRRMAALGYNVTAHRVAAYSVSAVIAGIAGILMVWQTSQISPGTSDIGKAIDILVIAVIGGMRHPIGPFIGAVIFVILDIFAPDFLSAVNLSQDRFQTLIGLGFLVIVFWSPDGILGLWDKFKASRNKDPLLDRGGDAP
ncbi:MAG: branched-chain amino acid ABC transporter permease [Pseudomonadota bacterium]